MSSKPGSTALLEHWNMAPTAAVAGDVRRERYCVEVGNTFVAVLRQVWLPGDRYGPQKPTPSVPASVRSRPYSSSTCGVYFDAADATPVSAASTARGTSIGA